MKYTFMQTHSGIFTVSAMCRVFVVSRSGYYCWRHRQKHPSESQKRRRLLDQQVAKAFVSRKERSGLSEITLDLQDHGQNYNRKTVAASMKCQGLRAKAAKKFKATTNSKHNLPVAPNLLLQNFNAATPNQKWVGDITYLWTNEGWLYLAVIIDLYSRMVIGWSISERMTAKGNCYDNACAESFFHTLNVEVVHGERLLTRDEMRKTLFEYIEVDYNRSRRHSANGISAQKRLRPNLYLGSVSVVAGQDLQTATV